MYYDVFKEAKLIEKSILQQQKLKNKKQTYIISSLVLGQPINEDFLEAIKHYAKKHKAKPLFLPAGPKERLSAFTGVNFFDGIVLEDTYLNNNLMLCPIYSKIDNTDPVRGTNQVSDTECSVIVGGTTQRLKCVPVGKNKFPKVLMSPGSISEFKYYSSAFLVGTKSKNAQNFHSLSAIIVEVVNKEIFHFRQVQYDRKLKGFIDLGILYTATSAKPFGTEALIPGDWHSGETDPKVKAALLSFLKKHKPRHIILHDFFNGTSVNHHEMHDITTRVKRFEKGQLNLKQELAFAAKELNELSKYTKPVVVRSNHDEFLDRYLKEVRYIKDLENYKAALELHKSVFDGENALKHGMKIFGNLNNKAIFLERDDSFKIAGIECGSHGDKGANGSRNPSAAALEIAYGQCVTGHKHTPEIFRGSWVVGTSTEANPDYGSGPNSWMQTACIVYKNGSRQLINFINGKYTERK